MQMHPSQLMGRADEIAAAPFTFALVPDADASETADAAPDGGAADLPSAITGAWTLSRHHERLVEITDRRTDLDGDEVTPHVIARVGVEWLGDNAGLRRGAPVRFVTDSMYGLGTITLRAALGSTDARFDARVVNDGDVGVYYGPHPTLPEWHLVTVRMAETDREHLVAPVHLSQFAAIA